MGLNRKLTNYELSQRDQAAQRYEATGYKSTPVVREIRKQDLQYDSEDYASDSQGILRIAGYFGEGCRQMPRHFGKS